MRKFKWIKVGRIISPQKFYWMKSHAMCPTPEILDDKTIRIFFSGRNNKNQSIIGHADLIFLDFPKRFKVVYSKKPDLEIGRLGTFDDNGVTPTCIVNYNKKKYLYYVGWNQGTNVRMHLFGGLAIKNQNCKEFIRYSEAPIIERNKVNPFLNTAPFVIKIKNNWVMYYVSGVEWVNKNLPRYNIQIAFSKDLKNWKRSGKVAINFKNKNEFALARPYVIKKGKYYYMWFSSKGNWLNGSNYKISLAYSLNGLKWQRLNDSVILKSNQGWDSEMIEYSSVIEFRNKFLMFYNGNNFGKTGIGLAISD